MTDAFTPLRIEEIALSAFCATPGNRLDSGKLIFDDPLIGIASADDPLFMRCKDPDVVGPGFLAPDEWLHGAQSVISLFFPLSESIRDGNRLGRDPSLDWIGGKMVGQVFISKVMNAIGARLSELGFCSIMPSGDSRFAWRVTKKNRGEGLHFESAWSERHVAFVCGLGTFGLSRGLITEQGTAGRFGSIVTTAELPKTERVYSQVDEWCTRCGACTKQCPVEAIDPAHGKDNSLCGKWCEAMKVRYEMVDACGKCQVCVPCEFKRP